MTNQQQATQPELRVPCLVFSRVVGFLTPVKFWNKGKRQEWEERKTYNWRAVVAGEGDK